jgi:hypothetical protein
MRKEFKATHYRVYSINWVYAYRMNKTKYGRNVAEECFCVLFILYKRNRPVF